MRIFRAILGMCLGICFSMWNLFFEVEGAALACLAGPGPVEPSRVGTDRAQRGGYVAGRDVPNLTSTKL